MKKSESTRNVVCEDPYWNGCKEEAAYVRIGEVRLKYRCTVLIYLCKACYDAMIEEGKIDPDEWESLI